VFLVITAWFCLFLKADSHIPDADLGIAKNDIGSEVRRKFDFKIESQSIPSITDEQPRPQIIRF
jgi:hypothetical protein